jgi:hypothetical protein
VIIDGDVQVVVAVATLAGAGNAFASLLCQLEVTAASRRYAPELLYIEMEQVAGALVLIADDGPIKAIEAVKTIEAGAFKHRIDG